MFVTPKFTFIHFPKAGGTFVEAMLSRLHPPVRRALPLRVARKLGLPVTVELPKHGTYLDIPQPYRGRPVLGVIRHPLDLYVSQFRFRRHLQHPEQFGGNSAVIRRRWPNYPNLSFEQYVRFLNQENTFLRFAGFETDDQPGLYTQHLLYFFSINRERAVRDLTSDSVHDGFLRSVLPRDLHLLMLHELNRGLYDYLLTRGYPARRIAFIREADRVMPEGGGRAADDHWSRYYSPELAAYVRRRERLLFEWFPVFAQQYDAHFPAVERHAA